MVRLRYVSRFFIPALIFILAGCAYSKPPLQQSGGARDPYLSLIQARYLENQGDYEQALTHYAAIEDPYARLAEARINFIMNHDREVLEITTRLIENQEYSTPALELRTKTHMRTGNWDEAISDAEAYLKEQPDNPDVQLMLANMYLRGSQTAQARSLLENLLRQENINQTAVHYALSRVCLTERNLDCARDELIKTLGESPDFLAAYRDLGRIYRMLGQQKKAEDTYQKLLELDPFSIDAHNDLASIYIQQERYADALVHIRTLIDIDPGPRIFRQLVLLELQEGLFAEALEKLQNYPDKTTEEFYLMAVAHTGLQQWDAAITLLDRLAAAEENSCDAILLKASILKDTGRTAAALETLAEGWELFGDDADCFDLGYELVTSLEKNGRRREGLDVALKLVESYPDNASILNFVGYIWADQGVNLEQARTMIARAIELKPEDGYILDSMAWVLYKMGHYDQAFDFMEKALSLIETDPTLNEHMGDILTALGMSSRALDYYLKAYVAADQPQQTLQEKIHRLAQ